MELIRHYGFAKTSMSDLAEAAKISRTALYKHFASKEDVFRGVAEAMYRQLLEAGREAANGEGDFAQRLRALLETKALFLEKLAGSQHGTELLQESQRLCGDLVRPFQAGYQALAVDLIQQADADGEIDLGPRRAEDVAQVLMRAMDGIAHDTMYDLVEPDRYRSQVNLLADMVSAGLVRRQ